MEKDYGSSSDKAPESKWDFFEGLEAEDKDKDKPRKKWFGAEDEPDIEAEKAKSKAESDDKADKESKKGKSKQSIVETEEFTKMTLEQKKTALAKEYVEKRSEELKEELNAVTEGSAEAIEISADLELIEALSEKLEHPEVIAENAVEEAYQQIMDRLDEIFNEQTDEDEPLPTLEEDELEDEPTQDEKPSIFARPRSKKNSSQSSPSGGPSPRKKRDPANVPPRSNRPKAEQQPVSPAENNGPKLKEVVPSSPFLARQRLTGNLAVSEAMNQMLSRRSEKTPELPEVSKTLEVPEVNSALPAQPERFVNPIKRSVEEKERRVRQMVTKQAIGEPIFESYPKSDEADYQPPVPIDSMRPVSYQERPTPTPTVEKRVTPEQSRDLAQSSTEQLLQIADKIKIDGTTLRSLYASNKIDRAGLTKVIKEALKGGDVKTALSKSTLGAEAQRGRKIEMRHDDQTFDDVKGYHQTTEAAKARTDRILESLDMVSQAKNTPTEGDAAPNIPDVKDQAMQKAEAASKKAKLAVIAVVALTATTIIFALLLAF